MRPIGVPQAQLPPSGASMLRTQSAMLALAVACCLAVTAATASRTADVALRARAPNADDDADAHAAAHSTAIAIATANATGSSAAAKAGRGRDRKRRLWSNRVADKMAESARSVVREACMTSKAGKGNPSICKAEGTRSETLHEVTALV